eukprot:1510450-Prymnesium_polylepis.1
MHSIPTPAPMTAFQPEHTRPLSRGSASAGGLRSLGRERGSGRERDISPGRLRGAPAVSESCPPRPPRPPHGRRRGAAPPRLLRSRRARGGGASHKMQMAGCES